MDLTDATRARAEAIARASGGPLCVRMRVGEDGEAIFRSPPLTPLRRAAAGVAVAALVSACDPATGASPTARPAVVAPLEPAAVDLGPPMLPVEAGAVVACANETAPPRRAGEDDAGAAASVEADEGAPTADQRARTRRKHRRTAHPPPPSMPMGLLLPD